ncbi:MAG: glycosyltransferase [Paludibacter sp.]|nr:glycosyltransferase [Paludibacter sp.]
MISVVICSRKSNIPIYLEENIKTTIGVDCEIIVIDNSENRYSIFTAYNKGFNLSKFPVLCFVHEDVYFKTVNWGSRIIEHLNDETCGIIGVAGGKIATKVPAQWSAEKSYLHIIQHSNKGRYSTLLKEPKSFSGVRQAAIVVDGVFLSMRRDIFLKIKFDESLDGFHGYDYDISIQSIVAGYKNYIIYDVLMEHYSEGYKDIRYYNSLLKIHKKWIASLPLFTDDNQKSKSEIQLIETKRLKKIIRRMARTGFPLKDAVANTSYFIQSLKSDDINLEINGVKLRFFSVRLLRFVRNLFSMKNSR